MTNSRGEVVTIPNAVGMHEEDYGILWKHPDWRTEETEVRRSRRLVVSFIATVANYEYGFFWYFYQDGTIQYEVKLTGIVNTTAVMPGETNKYGTLVAPQLNAPNHQHFFNVRLDMNLEGENNSVYEVNTEAEPISEDNPYGNAFAAKSTLLATELAAQRIINPMSGRYWKVVNPNVKNSLGQPVAYKIMPGENILPFLHPESYVIKRAGYLTKHLWVTPYNDLASGVGVGFFGLFIPIAAIVSLFGCTLASINAGARILFTMARQGIFHASMGKAHDANGTTHIAVTMSSLFVFLVPTSMSLFGLKILDVYGYLGTIATYGFLVTYILISIAAPMYLYREGILKVTDVAITIIAVLFMLVPVVGSIYPVPASPFNVFPYLFFRWRLVFYVAPAFSRNC